ncbi:MAG: pyridoxamine 5'-phosphate oxidase family protein [Bacteroidaceae bacterium]|nr:pyridoxamine 5'-phosphate oxidase family protein [Bacteroidaceae bacterium]
MNEQEKLIGELADNQKTVFLGSVDEQGFPNIKAMLQTRKREGIRIFYFTTNTSSMRVKQYLKNPKACVYFCNQDTFIGAMLLGTIEILTDDKSKQMIWRKGDEIYYPKGVTDPDYCVLRFTTLSGRIYRNFHSVNFEV